MPGIRLKENENFDAAMRRFKRVVEKSGNLSEMRKREFFEKPSSQKKRRTAAAVKRYRKKLQREQQRVEKGFAASGARTPVAARPTTGFRGASSQNRTTN